MRKIWLQIGRTSVARMYWLASSLITIFITAHVLGPAGRGQVAAATSWVSLFAVLGALSIASAIVFVASGRSESEWLPKTLGSVLTILGVASVCAWIVAAAIGLFAGSFVFRHLTPSLLVLAFATIPLVMWNESAGSLVVAIDSLDRLNLAQIIGATATLAGAWLFVMVLPWGVYGAILATALYHVIVGGSMLVHIARRAGTVTVDREVVKTLTGSGLRLHLNTIAHFTIAQMNVVLVNAFGSSEETGHYQLALQLITAIHMLPAVVGLSATTIVTRQGPDAAWPRHKALLFQATLVMAAISVAGFFLAPLIVRIIGGAAFAPTVPILRILLVALVPMTVGTVMASQWFARGMFLHLSLIGATVAVCSIVANLIVIPRYGAVGSAWVSNAIYAAGLLANLVFAVWVDRRAAAANAAGTAARPG